MRIPCAPRPTRSPRGVRTISTEHGACRSTACAVLPIISRVNAPLPCEPSTANSAFQSVANFGIACRGFSSSTSVLTGQPFVRRPAASSSNSSFVDFLVSSSSCGARTKKNGSTAVTSLNSDPFGHGRKITSCSAASDALDPSTPIRIFMPPPAKSVAHYRSSPLGVRVSLTSPLSIQR